MGKPEWLQSTDCPWAAEPEPRCDAHDTGRELEMAVIQSDKAWKDLPGKME